MIFSFIVRKVIFVMGCIALIVGSDGIWCCICVRLRHGHTEIDGSRIFLVPFLVVVKLIIFIGLIVLFFGRVADCMVCQVRSRRM